MSSKYHVKLISGTLFLVFIACILLAIFTLKENVQLDTSKQEDLTNLRIYPKNEPIPPSTPNHHLIELPKTGGSSLTNTEVARADKPDDTWSFLNTKLYVSLAFSAILVTRSFNFWKMFNLDFLKLQNPSIAKSNFINSLFFGVFTSFFIFTLLHWTTLTTSPLLTRFWHHEAVIKTIPAINILIFFCWQIPAWDEFMSKHFQHSPMINAPYSILTSSFSHQNLAHLGFNMASFSSLGPIVQNDIGQKSLLWLYLTAAMVSSLVSHLWKVLFFSRNHPDTLGISSLGASGAMYALLGFVAHSHPDMKLGLVFLPGVLFSAPVAVSILTIFDACFLLFCPHLSPLDHASHLGGLIFGYGYSIFMSYFK